MVIDARQMAVLVLFGVFLAKNPLTPTQEVMTKPVAAFRSVVIEDSRCAVRRQIR